MAFWMTGCGCRSTARLVRSAVRDAHGLELPHLLFVFGECRTFVPFSLIQQFLIVIGQSLFADPRGVRHSLGQQFFLFLNQDLETADAGRYLLLFGRLRPVCPRLPAASLLRLPGCSHRSG